MQPQRLTNASKKSPLVVSGDSPPGYTVAMQVLIRRSLQRNPQWKTTMLLLHVDHRRILAVTHQPPLSAVAPERQKNYGPLLSAVALEEQKINGPLLSAAASVRRIARPLYVCLCS